VGAQFHPRSPEVTNAVLQPLALVHGSYLLTVGTIEPRKNLAHALEAYALLPPALRERFPLVVAGAKGWRSGAMEARLRQLADRRQIRFLGHVPASDLPSLYAGAAAFVFPSLYEGFGLPPLEAMASGVPVLVSDRTSLPEVVGEAGVKLDPERADRTADVLSALLSNAADQQRLRTAGIDRARGFTWATCAARTLAAYLRP
jgi:alpha-1,3-rhamnosyl/mannosyltransferase